MGRDIGGIDVVDLGTANEIFEESGDKLHLYMLIQCGSEEHTIVYAGHKTPPAGYHLCLVVN